VDLTFGDYLRALITADMDLEPEDELNYRTAFISGFRARGIYPSGVRNFSEENLRWQPPSFPVEAAQIQDMIRKLDLSWGLSTGRRESFIRAEENGRLLLQWLRELPLAAAKEIRRDLGFYIQPEPDMPKGIRLNRKGLPKLEIHGVRPARRINSRNEQITDLVVEAVQQLQVVDPSGRLHAVDRPAAVPDPVRDPEVRREAEADGRGAEVPARGGRGDTGVFRQRSRRRAVRDAAPGLLRRCGKWTTQYACACTGRGWATVS
jgi:hypothetical protein